jgi:hypothetical protein
MVGGDDIGHGFGPSQILLRSKLVSIAALCGVGLKEV